jgi:hypothetical protein
VSEDHIVKFTTCVHEQSVVEAAKSGQWSEPLRSHFAGCALCQESLQVSTWMQDFAETADEARELPDPRLIWLKARLAQRQAAAAEALRPLEFFNRVAYTVVGLLLVASLVMKWPHIEAWQRHLNSSSAAVFGPSGLASLFVPLASLTLGLLSLAALFAVYAVFVKE